MINSIPPEVQEARVKDLILNHLRGFAETSRGGNLWQSCQVTVQELKNAGWQIRGHDTFYRLLRHDPVVLELKRSGKITFNQVRKPHPSVQLRLSGLPVPPTEEERLEIAVRLGVKHMVAASEGWEGADPAISASVIRRRLAMMNWPLLDYMTLCRRLQESPEYQELYRAGKLRRTRQMRNRAELLRQGRKKDEPS